MTWANGHRTIRTLTRLNEATTARYTRCVTNGGHTPSGDSVTRWFPGADRILPICRSCGCPYGGPRTTWNGVSKERAG